jgi:hypothetical protein
MRQESGDDAATEMFDAEGELLAPDEVTEFKQAAHNPPTSELPKSCL